MLRELLVLRGPHPSLALRVEFLEDRDDLRLGETALSHRGQWRREWDSNPRKAQRLQRFSRPPHSTALPSLHRLIYRGFSMHTCLAWAARGCHSGAARHSDTSLSLQISLLAIPSSDAASGEAHPRGGCASRFPTRCSSDRPRFGPAHVLAARGRRVQQSCGEPHPSGMRDLLRRSSLGDLQSLLAMWGGAD